MKTLYVQFSDSTDTAIVSVFANAQDPVQFPNQGTVLSNDARYVTYYDALPLSVQALMPAPNS